MSITNDLRAYADSAVHQGKQTFSTAQSQFSGVTEQASEIVNRFGDAVTDRAEELVGALKHDPRFSKLFETADSLSTVVTKTVQERVVKPVRSLTTGTPSAPPRESATSPATFE